MSQWKSVCEMPEDFFGDVWVFSKHLKEPELAYTFLASRGKHKGERLFEEIHAVFDSDGIHKEYYEDVTHYMEVIPPAPPTKPESIWIDGHRVSFTEGSVHIGNKGYDYCFSSHAEDIRKLGEWCISVADWREAQDAGK